MIVMVSGPYSAPTSEQKQANLDAMNRVAVEVLNLGHIPMIGVNAALPVAQMVADEMKYETIMTISLALAEFYDAVVMIGTSPGADRERAVFERSNRPVFHSLAEFKAFANRV